MNKYIQIKNLFLDTNILSRMLKSGISESVARVNAQLKERSIRLIKERDTDLVITPSGMFEYAGIKKEDFLSSNDLKSICEFPDPNDAHQYFDQVHKRIKERVSQVPLLQRDKFSALFSEKLNHLPKDSQEFVQVHFIDRISSDPDMIFRIHEAIAFHLFFSAPIPMKYAKKHHIYGVFLTFHLFKRGHVASVAKLLPKIWQGMTGAESAGDIPDSERKLISKLLGMHEVGDFLDSDLIHLAAVGIMKRNAAESVYCLTEDPALDVRQRVFLYRILIRNLLIRAREVDDRPNSTEFKNLDMRWGYVVCLNSSFGVIDYFKVQKLHTVGLTK